MNPDDERDDLWELLGQAKKPGASSFFARNILREIRREEPSRSGMWQWLARRWRVVALSGLGLAALVVTAGTLETFKANHSVVPEVELARQTTDKSDYEIIARLDFLLASENNSIWFENPPE